MLNFSTREISSYAKILLSEWRTLCRFMVEDSGIEKSEANEANHSLPVLSEEIIFAALEGPFHYFYQQFIPAHAKIIRVQTELNIRESEGFKDNRASIAMEDMLSEKQLVNISPSVLDAMLKKLNEAAQQYHSLWHERLSSWLALIIADCQKAGIALTELETTEFRIYEPLATLRGSYIDHKIKFLYADKEPIDLSKYLHAKTYLLLRNALARQQQEHADSAVKTNLKKIKAAFNAIQKQESQLAKEQQKAIYEIVSKLG